MEQTPYLNYWVMQVFGMLITVLLVPRLRVTGITGLLAMVAAIAAVNAFLWDASLFFEIPDSLTLRTLRLLVINGVIFWALVKILPGIEIEGVLPAIAAPVVFTLCTLLVYSYGGQVDWVTAIKSGGTWLVEMMRGLQSELKQPS